MRLPAELRNLVYEFALSEEQGLTYHRDERRLGWLCLHQLIEAATSVSDAGAPVAESQANPGSRKRRKLNNGTPQETGAWGPHSMVCIGKFTVANQLQFVSHQLRRETRGLGLRYNDISIFDSMSHITKLFHSLSPRQTSWLRKVVVKAEHGWDAKPAANGASTSAGDGGWEEIAEAYPQLNIHIHSPDVRISSGSYFLMALIIQHRGRGNNTFLERLSPNPRMRRIMTDLVETSTAERPRLASCVKMFPWDTEFDKKAFETTCLMTDKLAHVLSACPEFKIEDLTAIAKDWVSNGF